MFLNLVLLSEWDELNIFLLNKLVYILWFGLVYGYLVKLKYIKNWL